MLLLSLAPMALWFCLMPLSIATGSSLHGGYALRFGDEISVAAPRKSFIDVSDPGIGDIDKEITLMVWAKMPDSSPHTSCLLFSWATIDDLNLFQPFVLFQDHGGLVFGRSIRNDLSNVAVGNWNHYAVSLTSEGKLVRYVNGLVVGSDQFEGDYSLRGIETTFNLGVQLYTRVTTAASLYPSKSFYGDIDELSIFSRGLNASEIEAYAHGGPLDTDNLDSSVVVHYDFNGGCQNLISGASTTIGTGCEAFSQGVAKNYGSAGTNFDLLLGRMNNDFGHGLTFYVPSSTTCQVEQIPFGVPTLVPNEFIFPNNAKLDGSFRGKAATPTVIVMGTAKESFVLPKSLTNETLTLVALPSSGLLGVETGLASLNIGESFSFPSNGTLFVSCVNSSALQEPDLFQLQVGNDPAMSIQVHIWPHRTVAISTDTYHVTLMEDDAVVLRLLRLAAKAGHDLDAQTVITRLPERGTLAQIEYSPKGIGDQVGMDIASAGLEEWVISNPVGAVKYTPDIDGSGYDYDFFQVEFRSRASNKRSAVLRVQLNIEPINDLPAVKDISLLEGVLVSEDSTDGVIVTLSAQDADDIPGLVISRLPTSGTLYTVTEDGKKGRVIDKVYSSYDKGTGVESMYAQQVLSVSSFWGGPPYTGYHALNVLGSPTCGSTGNKECTDERNLEDESIPVGDYVRVQHDGLVRLGRIFNKTATGDYDVLISPMYKWDHGRNESRTCWLVGPGFPGDCDFEAADALNSGGLHEVARGIAASDLLTIPAGVWCPLKRKETSDKVLSGGEAAAAYGVEYDFSHNPSDGYRSSPRFTEYVEVRYASPTFLLGVEIGSPRGAGAIAAVRAKAPDGSWMPLYQGGPEPTLADITARGQYVRWSPKVCEPFFMTTDLRVELDTSDATGVADWNYIDYIKVSGSVERQAAMLINSKVLYVPNKNFNGVDTFEYSAYDCGGDDVRASRPATVSVNVSAVVDPLGIAWHPDGFERGALDVLFDMDSEEKQLGVSIFALEEDGRDIEMVLTRAPASGHFELESRPGVALVAGDLINLDDGIHKKRSRIVYFRAACTTREATVVDFTVDAVALLPTGTGTEIATLNVSIVVDCSKLPKRFAFDEISHGAQAFALFLGISGLLIAFAMSVFQIKYKTVPVVRITSPRINLLVIGGSFFAYSYIITYSGNMSTTSPCREAQFWDQNRIWKSIDGTPDFACEIADNDCCNDLAISHCTTNLVCLSLGFCVSFCALIAKTTRIHRLLTKASLNKKDRRSDKSILIWVGLSVLVLLAFIVIWITLSPFTITFEPGSSSIDGQTDRVLVSLVPKCGGLHYDTFVNIASVVCVLVLLYGAWISFKVRNVQLRGANDSTQLFLSIYNIMFTGALGLGISSTIQERTARSYIMSAAIFSACTFTLCALFVPRVLDVARGNTELIASSRTSHTSHANPSSAKYEHSTSSAVVPSN